MEYGQDETRQGLCDWINGAGDLPAAFDFTLKGILQEAVGKTQYWRLRDKDGKPNALIGWWPEKAVTFLDNHDTGRIFDFSCCCVPYVLHFRKSHTNNVWIVW